VEEQNNLTRDEARLRAALVSDPRYRVHLDFSGHGATYGMEATIRFRCAERGAATFLDLIAERVERVEVNGSAQELDVVDGARIHLRGLAEQNEVRILARMPYSHTGQGVHRFRDPVDDLVYLYTDFEPFDAHRAFACFDQPDLKGVFEFVVTGPSDWVVVSNMAPAGDPRNGGDGSSTWSFPPTPPLSPYITAIVAGPYHAIRDRDGDIPLGLLCRQSMARYLEPDREEILEVTRQGFAFFQEEFDYPYAFGKYDQVFVPEFNSGAMENAGCVTFNESYLFRSKVTDAARERRAETILHEMAHMWFGDLVTMGWWDDLWLNESFATFMSVLALVDATRFTGAWTTFTNSEKTWAYYQDQLPSTHPIVADMPDTESIHTNFDGITYAKGASVLRQLVAWVGGDEFRDGVRRYFRRHEYGNTDLSDFLTALEESSGRDLQAWAKEWLQTTGVNVLRASFDLEDGGDRFRSFHVVQEAPPESPILRPHRVAIGLYDAEEGSLKRRRRVELDVAGSNTEVDALAGERAADLSLVNDEDLAYARIRLDPRSLQTVTDHLGQVEDPLARALCWGAAWDMVRDAEMPTRSFLSLVLGNIHAEGDIGVVQRILGQLAGAIESYSDPGNRDAARESLAEFALDALRSASPGSDVQLVWARAFASVARSQEHVAIVRGLLDGDMGVEGLDVDTELRWHLVRSLAAAGVGDEGLIRSELERDPTDTGRRHAASARAARPTRQAKAEAWASITGDASLTTAMLGATMQGFQAPGQEELLRLYIEPYFEALGPMWRDRTLEVAVLFARAMFPSQVVERATVDATDRYLDRAGVPGPVNRTVVEGRDGVLRALRARVRDREG